MAVDTTIPNSSNNVGDDLSAIRENFELLASAQVVDEGSTADGDYIRFQNGWQICKKTVIVTLTETGQEEFVYPINFDENIDEVAGSGLYTRSPGTGVYNAIQSTFTTTFGGTVNEWRVRNTETGNEDREMALFAIGRWK